MGLNTSPILNNEVKFLEVLLKSISGFVYVFDFKTNKVLYTSESIEKYLGFTAEELNQISKNSQLIEYLYHPDDHSFVRLSELEFLTNTNQISIPPREYRMRTKMNGYKWFSCTWAKFTFTQNNTEIDTMLITAIEITDYKNNEEFLTGQLQHQAMPSNNNVLYIRQLTATLENTPNVAIQWFTEQGYVLYWNKGSEMLYGFTAEEMIGKSLEGYIHTYEENQEFLAILAEIKRTGNPYGPYEASIKRRNGESGWVLATTFLLPLENDNWGFVCMDVDITMQKKSVEELKQVIEYSQIKETELLRINEEYAAIIEEIRQLNEDLMLTRERADLNEMRIKQISDSFGMGMLYQVVLAENGDRKFTYVSESVKQLYGYTPEQILNDSSLIYGCIHPDDLPRLIESENKVLENMSVFKEEVRIRLPNGTYRWSYLVSTPRFDDGVLFWDGIEVDITDRKKLETEREQYLGEITKARDEAARAREVLNVIMERVSDGFVAFDADFNYTFVNSHGGALLGRKPEELIGKNYWTEYPEAKETPFAKAYVRAFETQQPIIFEEYYEFWDRWFVNRIYPSPEGITIFFTDITERKKNEAAILEAKEKAEEANAELLILNEELKIAKDKAEESDMLKSSFLQNMSHEVRTPLNAIAGFAKLISEAGQSQERLKMYADIIVSSSEKLVGIITDVIEVSQLQSHQAQLLVTEFDLVDFLNQFDKEFSGRAAEKKIIFRKIINLQKAPAKVVSDYEKLKKIVYHLLDNAVKFTQEGYVELYCSLSDENMLIQVSDTGIGITPEKQNEVFLPFTQVETGITRIFGGNGLGLTLVKSYIDLLHGSIELLSEVNKGTKFTIKVPINQDAEVEIGAPGLHLNKSIENVLIVEDEYFNFVFLRTLFMNTGVHIIHARDGQQALDECLKNNNLDIVLMDINMPVMDGYTAARLIKEKFPDLPIIATSAYVLENERQMYGNVFDDFLVKPINQVEFTDKILHFIKKK